MPASLPLVSIVIPVFNGADYLGQAIDSALAQTYPNIEVIVVDDGSTDGGATRDIALGYGDRLRYVHKPNGGVATALNLGIEMMRGEWFSWLSHDDLYCPDKVAAQVDAARRFGRPCVVVGIARPVRADNTPVPDWIAALPEINLTNRPLDAVFSGLLNGCAMLIPRSVLSPGCFEPGLPTTQDYHLWFRLVDKVPFLPLEQVVTHQRLHPNQGSHDPTHLAEAGRLFIHMIEAMPPDVMEAYEGSVLRFLMRRLATLYPYPGLHAHLIRRMGQALRETAYTLVLLGTGDAAALGVQVRASGMLTLRPRAVLVLDLGITGDRAMLTEALHLTPDGALVVPPTANVAGFLNAASIHTATDILISATVLPCEAEIVHALAALIHTGADIARPRGWAPESGPFEKFAMRRSAVVALGDTGRQTPWSGEVAEYPLFQGMLLPRSQAQEVPARQRQSRPYHVLQPRLWKDEPLRVLVLDAATAPERALVADVIALAERSGLPIHFHRFRPVDGLSWLQHRLFHPAAAPGDVWDIIGGIVPHLAWLPPGVSSDSPEFDSVMRAMLPLAVPESAAVAGRCRNRRHTWLLPCGMPPSGWNDFFLSRRAALSDQPVSL